MQRNDVHGDPLVELDVHHTINDLVEHVGRIIQVDVHIEVSSGLTVGAGTDLERCLRMALQDRALELVDRHAGALAQIPSRVDQGLLAHGTLLLPVTAATSSCTFRSPRRALSSSTNVV
jgi:hypothetical protein